MFPGISPLVARQRERVRLRIGNLTKTNHPIHLHGHEFTVTGTHGGPVPKRARWPEVTTDIAVGQMRQIDFIADEEGDWAFHCHKSHHTMNAMGHRVPTMIGVDHREVVRKITRLVPDDMVMGERGMADMGEMAMPLPDNTAPMMTGHGPFGGVEMDDMFSVLKVRRQQPRGDYTDPGWFQHPPGPGRRRWMGLGLGAHLGMGMGMGMGMGLPGLSAAHNASRLPVGDPCVTHRRPIRCPSAAPGPAARPPPATPHATAMLFEPSRHEPLRAEPWQPARAQACIQRIVDAAEAAWSPERLWPMHPQDADSEAERQALSPTLYFGAIGVIWGLRRLQALGAATLRHDHGSDLRGVHAATLADLAGLDSDESASYLMGLTPLLMLALRLGPQALPGAPTAAEVSAQLAALIEGNRLHPAREQLLGAPGTLLAALLEHRRTGEDRWARLFRDHATTLWGQMLWSEAHQCHYWTQDLHGRTSTYIDAVHGFVGTALPILHGRHLLPPEAPWPQWQARIANLVRRTATWEDGQVNWRAFLIEPEDRPRKWLMQHCHGAPGFITSLAAWPGPELDDLLLAGGEAIWAAGPLAKGSNLCHGTGGNGHAFLKLWRRTGDQRWLARARAFAMHGMAQTEAATTTYGMGRHSLWTGDIGFALFLWDCLQGSAEFPTLDVF